MPTPARNTGLAAALGLIATLIGGCAGTVPEAIRTPAPGDVQLAEVRAQPQAFRGTPVRWGGPIVAARNERDHSVLEIIARDLDGSGRPRAEDRSPGRFLIKAREFLDPAIYKPEREVTVRGRIEDVIEQPIGEFRYRYPVVLADEIHLWKPRLPPPDYPRYYDPYWYDPWYPWGWPHYRPWPGYP